MRSAIPVILVLFMSAAAPAQPHEKARATVEKAVMAHGAARINRLRVAKVTFTLQGSMPFLPRADYVNITVEESYQMPRQIKKVMHGISGGMDFALSWAYDGERVWELDKLGRITTHAQTQDCEGIYRPFLIIELLANYDKFEWSMAHEESRKDDDSFAALARSNQTGAEITFYFDKTTALLSGTSTRRVLLPTNKAIFQEDHYSGYKEIDGVLLPMRQTINHDGKKVADIRVSDVRFFEKLDDGEFAPPGSGMLQLALASLLGLASCFLVGWFLGKLQVGSGFPAIRLAITSAIVGGLTGFPVGLLVAFAVQSLGYSAQVMPPFMVGVLMGFGGACAGFGGGWLSGRKARCVDA